MPAKEGDSFSSEIWSLIGNPLPDNLIETYMRYTDSLPPHERKAVLKAPNPNDGYIEIKDLRTALTERTPAGIHIALIIYKDTLNEMTPGERAEALENPQTLIDATIQRLKKATPDSNTPIYF